MALLFLSRTSEQRNDVWLQREREGQVQDERGPVRAGMGYCKEYNRVPENFGNCRFIFTRATLERVLVYNRDEGTTSISDAAHLQSYSKDCIRAILL